MNKSKLLSSGLLYRGFFNVRDDHLQINGKDFHYLSVETPSDAVLVLPITPSGKYILTLEYRYPVRETLLSVPGGYIDAQESLEESAARELLEETGYTAENYRLLGSAYPYAGISSQKIHYVLAENAVLKHAPQREVSEQIEIIEISHQELAAKIAGGIPVDGNLCTILFYRGLSL